MSYMRVRSEIFVTGIVIEDEETRFRLSVKPQSQTLWVTWQITEIVAQSSQLSPFLLSTHAPPCQQCLAPSSVDCNSQWIWTHNPQIILSWIPVLSGGWDTLWLLLSVSCGSGVSWWGSQTTSPESLKSGPSSKPDIYHPIPVSQIPRTAHFTWNRGQRLCRSHKPTNPMIILLPFPCLLPPTQGGFCTGPRIDHAWVSALWPPASCRLPIVYSTCPSCYTAPVYFRPLLA